MSETTYSIYVYPFGRLMDDRPPLMRRVSKAKADEIEAAYSDKVCVVVKPEPVEIKHE